MLQIIQKFWKKVNAFTDSAKMQKSMKHLLTVSQKICILCNGCNKNCRLGVTVEIIQKT